MPAIRPLPRERERYYLLPGMGGRNSRRKRKLILTWTLVAGILFSGAMAAILYFMNRVH